MNKKFRFSIKQKLFLLAAAIATPLIFLILYLLVSMVNYSQTYDAIVRNLTIANNYNLNFKEEMDESLYKLVVGYTSFENIGDDDSLKDPYILIKELRDEFTKLSDITRQTESKMWLDSLLRNINTLENRVKDIEENSKYSGNYQQNIEELDNNIYILTELIQDDIQYYIYYQTKSMERVNASLNQQLRRFYIVFSVFVLVCLVAMVAFAILIAMGIVKPIHNLNQATTEVAMGNLDARAKVQTNDEISDLAEDFNTMAENMKNLISHIKEDEQKMRRADLRLLQEQINPHFLYNTLDTIVWLIEAEENQQAVDMVVTLSDFFRLVLSKGKEFITIHEEERHIRSYLEIQSMRYRDIMDYEILIDEDLYQYQILKLTLQPLVENALYHGIKYKRAKGTIRVTGKKQGDCLVFVVSDDGVGMEAEELNLLRSEIEKPCQESEKGFGLANVNERIHMYFGKEYGMQIDSEKGKGTSITITIPAMEKEGTFENKNEI